MRLVEIEDRPAPPPPPWIWLSPILAGFAHWQRTYANKIWGGNPSTQVEARYVADHVMPYFWSTVAIALLILAVFGRRREARRVWFATGIAFLLGWLVPGSS